MVELSAVQAAASAAVAATSSKLQAERGRVRRAMDVMKIGRLMGKTLGSEAESQLKGNRGKGWKKIRPAQLHSLGFRGWRYHAGL